MPNWIEGSLKLRGSSENLKRFFTEMIQPSTSYGEEAAKKEDFISCDFPDNNDDSNSVEIRHDAWIKGTRRAFVNDDCWVVFDNDDRKHTVCLPIRQAWAFDADSWCGISAECGIDIRLYGIECGMQFCQEIEIIDGELVSNREIKYDDWEWECPLPFMGG